MEQRKTVSYHFYMRDHLGSNRVVASAAGVAEQANHYYPFIFMIQKRNDIWKVRFKAIEDIGEEVAIVQLLPVKELKRQQEKM